MVKVFITAGAGVIGSKVALALRRRGHDVTTLVRDELKGRKLVEGEVHVLVGDIFKPETYHVALKEADVIIDTAIDFTSPGFDLKVYNILLEEIKKAGGNKKKLILTSGILVYQSSQCPLTEESPLSEVPLIQSRIQITKDLIANKDVYGTMLVPSSVYGCAGGNALTYFYQAEQGKVVVSGSGKNILSCVHVEDVADAYVKVVEADPQIVSGQVFNLGEDKKATSLEVAHAFASAAGYKGEIETGAPFPFPFFPTDVTLYFDNSKTKRVLGWNPSRKDITLEAPVLYKAWKASGSPSSYF